MPRTAQTFVIFKVPRKSPTHTKPFKNRCRCGVLLTSTSTPIHRTTVSPTGPERERRSPETDDATSRLAIHYSSAAISSRTASFNIMIDRTNQKKKKKNTPPKILPSKNRSRVRPKNGKVRIGFEPLEVFPRRRNGWNCSNARINRDRLRPTAKFSIRRAELASESLFPVTATEIKFKICTSRKRQPTRNGVTDRQRRRLVTIKIRIINTTKIRILWQHFCKKNNFIFNKK